MHIDLLPLDVFAIICGYLKPNDLLKLAFVNKNIHDLVNTRTVWIDQCLRVIGENGLYAPSFPLRKMSASELMKTACGPGRMVDRFWSKHIAQSAEDPPVSTEEDRRRNGYTHPPLTRLPDGVAYELPSLSRYSMRSLGVPEGVPLAQYSDLPLMYRKICLIPGGRFLACVVEGEAFIWDLGTPAQSNTVSPTIYCRWPVTGDEIFMPGPSANGNELRLVMGSIPESSSATLSVYRIWEEELQHHTPSEHGQDDAEAPQPVVKIEKHVCRLHVPDEIAFFTIFGDISVYMYCVNPYDWLNRYYVVCMWDFIHDTYASWNVATAFAEVFIDNGFLCMIQLPEVVGWKIPPLRPWKEVQQSQSGLIITPSFRVGLGGPARHFTRPSIPDRSFVSLIGRLLDWYNILTPLRQYDGILFNSEEQSELWTYGMYNWPDQWLAPRNEGYEENMALDGNFSNNPTYFVNDGAQQQEQYVPEHPVNPPYIRLQHAAAFIGDAESRPGITIDPYRICDGYTVKSIVSSDCTPFVLVELPERTPQEEVDAHVQEEEENDRMRPRRVITLRLDVPIAYVPPPIYVPGDEDDQNPNQNQDDESSTAPSETTQDDVEQLADELSELALGSGGLTMPLPENLLGRTDFSFDPCSGRFCFIAAGRRQIGIVEFLKWG